MAIIRILLAKCFCFECPGLLFNSCAQKKTPGCWTPWYGVFCWVLFYADVILLWQCRKWFGVSYELKFYPTDDEWLWQWWWWRCIFLIELFAYLWDKSTFFCLCFALQLSWEIRRSKSCVIFMKSLLCPFNHWLSCQAVKTCDILKISGLCKAYIGMLRIINCWSEPEQIQGLNLVVLLIPFHLYIDWGRTWSCPTLVWLRNRSTSTSACCWFEAEFFPREFIGAITLHLYVSDSEVRWIIMLTVEKPNIFYVIQCL